MFKKYFIMLCLLMVFFSLLGCVGEVVSVNVNPKISVRPHSYGENNKIVLNILDSRTTKSLGAASNTEGLAFDMMFPQASIKITLLKQMSYILKQYGFVVVYPAQRAGRELTLNIIQFHEKEVPNIFNLTSHAAALFIVVAHNNHSVYRKVYTATSSAKSLGKSGTEKALKNTLTKVLTKIATDKKLFQFLG